MDIGFIIVIALLLILFFVSGYVNERRSIKEYENRLKNEYGHTNQRKFSADELKASRGFDRYKQTEGFIDDITWNDLDMWSVYKQMNYCHSSAGDEYLYYMLKNPSLNGNWEAFEKLVSDLTANEEERIKLQLCLNKMGRSGKYSIFDYLNKLDSISLYSNLKDIFQAVLYVPAVILCFFNGLIGAASIILLVVINVATYFRKKKSVEPYIVCFNYVYKVFVNAQSICTIKNDSIEKYKLMLQQSLSAFKLFKRFYFLVSGNAGNGPLGILLDYLKMFTHIDLILFKSMVREIANNREQVVKILETIGYIDCAISVGEYRSSLDYYCIPTLNNEIDNLKISEVYHPLLVKPVSNTIETKKGILLTGSNASGKSTFLKTVALNIILAQSIHTVCASSYEASYFRVFTSLNLKDSIKSGDSYYMAEIKAIKRIIDATDYDDVKVVAFVDEVLRGTNTTERIAASSTILSTLSLNGVLVFAATHDLELTGILVYDFENYHFEENMDGEDVTFPYKLAYGKATSRNAIKLLGKLGFEENITNMANNMVERFESKGTWSLK